MNGAADKVVLPGGLDPNQALSVYFKEPNWRSKTLIGGLLNFGAFMALCLHRILIPVAFLFMAVVIGYQLRVMRTKMVDANAVLPKWDDWADLCISGLTWIAVVCGQAMVVISVATIVLMVGSANTMINASNSKFMLWGACAVGLVSITWILVAFFSTML
ncbi:MAG TPA: DUF4013 domain-containing protein, partial [Chroococcales cyanobacterium]